MRAAFGIFFIAWSWISTVLIVGWLLEPVMHDTATTGLIADRLLIGFTLAFLVSVAEFVSAERWRAARAVE